LKADDIAALKQLSEPNPRLGSPTLTPTPPVVVDACPEDPDVGAAVTAIRGDKIDATASGSTHGMDSES